MFQGSRNSKLAVLGDVNLRKLEGFTCIECISQTASDNQKRIKSTQTHHTPSEFLETEENKGKQKQTLQATKTNNEKSMVLQTEQDLSSQENGKKY